MITDDPHDRGADSSAGHPARRLELHRVAQPVHAIYHRNVAPIARGGQATGPSVRPPRPVFNWILEPRHVERVWRPVKDPARQQPQLEQSPDLRDVFLSPVQYHVVKLGILTGVPDNQEALRLAPPAAVNMAVVPPDPEPVPGADEPRSQAHRPP